MAQRALVIGSQTGGLLGTESDAKNIAEALGARGFKVDVRTGGLATQAGILDGYARLIQDSQVEDAAAIYYSGHGHHAVSRDRAKDVSPTFQGIVPTDFDSATGTDYLGITAWELSILLARLTVRTRNVVVMYDCCHAAQMSRDGAVRDAMPRALPHPLSLPSFRPYVEALRRQYPGELEALDPKGNAHAVRLVACAQSESAFEYTNRQGMRTGAFTEALLEVFQEIGTAQISWGVLMQAVRERVLRLFPTQRPDVEGPQRRKLFTTDDDTRAVVPVTTTPAGVQLAAGRLHGVREGDVYAVMPVAAKGFDAGAAVALVRVERAGASSADAVVTRWLNGHASLPGQAVAVLREIAAGRRAIRIEAPDEHRAAIERAIVETRTLQPAMPADRALVTLRLADARLTIEDDGGALFPPAAYPGELAGTVDNLKGIGVAEALRELEGEHGVSAREVEIELGVVDGDELRPLRDRGDSLGLGDRIGVRIKNCAKRTLYAHVFNVGVRGHVTRLTTFAAAGVPLDAGEEFVLGRNFATGVLDGLRLYWPAGLPTDSFPRMDEIVVVVTNVPADLAGLETRAFVSTAFPSRTRGPRNPLEGLLTQLQTGTRRDAGEPGIAEDYRVKRLAYLLHPRAGAIADITFELDENPGLRASTRAASAWVGRDPAVSGPASAAIAIGLNELVVDGEIAASGSEVRVDALVCTRSSARGGTHRATTLLGKVESGRVSLDAAQLFDGPVCDFVEIHLWVSSDAHHGPVLADLLARRAAAPAVGDASAGLHVSPGREGAPWASAAGASAALARTGYQALRAATATTRGVYRTSFLADERFGVGRHPAEGLHRTDHFSFSLVVDASNR